MLQLRRRLVQVLLPAVCAIAPVCAMAQSGDSPRKGTWGAEAIASTGQGASLLRFLSPRWALVAAVSVSSIKVPAADFGERDRLTSTDVRFGVRQYLRRGIGLRPVVGAGIALARNSPFQNAAGGYVEAGAVYLFNRHVSLGAIGSASASALNDGGSSFSFTLARLVGSVYF